MQQSDRKLPPITVIIEWENAIDVVDTWTQRAMRGLARELAAVGPHFAVRPRVLYLYDRKKVPAGTIESAIAKVAPELRDLADLEIIPTEGLTYYKLKNYGVARTRTDLAVMIDSDAIPQPGWLEGLLAPFADPEVMAVGGFTRLGHEEFLSRAMALSWIFNLRDEGAKTERRNSVHVNNFAVRTAFFRDHPFPDLEAFKKQCVFWLRGIRSQGHRYVRSAAAQAIHAPHPGLKFLVWRAWTAGFDSDFVTYHTRTRNRVGHFHYSFVHFAKKLGRAWYRILFRAHVVGMPLWERPFALCVALGYFGILLAAQIWSALTRRFKPLLPVRPLAPILAETTAIELQPPDIAHSQCDTAGQSDPPDPAADLIDIAGKQVEAPIP
jgi:hypothetical protein